MVVLLALMVAAAGSGLFALWCGYTIGYDHGRNDHEDGLPHRDDWPLWVRWQRFWGRPTTEDQ